LLIVWQHKGAFFLNLLQTLPTVSTCKAVAYRLFNNDNLKIEDIESIDIQQFIQAQIDKSPNQ
jgi:hypothetical protein